MNNAKRPRYGEFPISLSQVPPPPPPPPPQQIQTSSGLRYIQPNTNGFSTTIIPSHHIIKSSSNIPSAVYVTNYYSNPGPMHPPPPPPLPPLPTTTTTAATVQASLPQPQPQSQSQQQQQQQQQQQSPSSSSSNNNNSTSTSSQYCCEQCNAYFANAENFNTHMKLHSNANATYSTNMSGGGGIPTSTNQTLIINNEVNHNHISYSGSSKLPYLTSILRKQQQQQPNNNSANNSPSKAKVAPPPPQPAPSNYENHRILGKNHTNPNTDNDDRNSPNNQTFEEEAQALRDYFIKDSHYWCGDCNINFETSNDHINHMKYEHCEQVFRCVICKDVQIFDSVALLKHHFVHIHGSKQSEMFRCKLCSSTYRNVIDFANHLKLSHANDGVNLASVASVLSSPLIAAASNQHQHQHQHHHLIQQYSKTPIERPTKLLQTTTTTMLSSPSQQNNKDIYVNEAHGPFL